MLHFSFHAPRWVSAPLSQLWTVLTSIWPLQQRTLSTLLLYFQLWQSERRSSTSTTTRQITLKYTRLQWVYLNYLPHYFTFKPCLFRVLHPCHKLQDCWLGVWMDWDGSSPCAWWVWPNICIYGHWYWSWQSTSKYFSVMYRFILIYLRPLLLSLIRRTCLMPYLH